MSNISVVLISSKLFKSIKIIFEFETLRFLVGEVWLLWNPILYEFNNNLLLAIISEEKY